MRLGAIQTALDRGFGKPTQHLEAEVSVYDSLGLAEQQTLLAALDQLDLVEGEADEVMPVTDESDHPVVLTQPGGDPDYAKIPATDGLGGREELEFVGVFATDEKGEVGELVVKGQRRGKDTD